MHSRFDPLEEARFLVKDIPLRERTMYVVLGFGLGYHVKELLQRIPRSSHVVVLEPDSACLSRVLLKEAGSRATPWMLSDRLHFLAHSDPEVTPYSLADRLVGLRLNSIELFTHIPSALTDEVFFRKLLDIIPRGFPVSFDSRLNILDKMLENQLLNFWSNLPHSWKASPVNGLQGRWNGRPAVIVSAGPSLTGALPGLGKARGNALVVATGTAARVLMEHRIQPDLVISTDPYQLNSLHFEGWDGAEVPLVYYHWIWRGIPASYTGPKFYFIMKDDPPIPLAAALERPDFRQGGSVAFSALQIAHYLEANPIVFVGQDFAFADGHTHAEGTLVNSSFDNETLPPDYLRVPGVSGNPVTTSRIYLSYLLYMQEYLLNYGRLHSDIRHINTSAIGARIAGTENIPLERALAECGARTGLSPREVILGALGETGTRPANLERTVDRWIADIERISGRPDDFAEMFSRFRGTSVYRQAPGSYEGIYYLYEVRYRSAGRSGESAFRSRFMDHLRYVRETLLGIAQTV